MKEEEKSGVVVMVVVWGVGSALSSFLMRIYK